LVEGHCDGSTRWIAVEMLFLQLWYLFYMRKVRTFENTVPEMQTSVSGFLFIFIVLK